MKKRREVREDSIREDYRDQVKFVGIQLVIRNILKISLLEFHRLPAKRLLDRPGEIFLLWKFLGEKK